MKNTLSGAMATGQRYISHSFRLAGGIYDHAGFLTMRALTDDQFLHIPHGNIPSPHFQKAALAVNGIKGVAREKAFKLLEDTYAHGNVGPKPDVKKPALGLAKNMLQMATTYLPKISPTQTVIVAAGLCFAAAVVHFAPDAASNLMGSKPSSSAALPKLPRP